MLFEPLRVRNAFAGGCAGIRLRREPETEIRGFARLGIPVGVSVNYLNSAAVDALVELSCRS